MNRWWVVVLAVGLALGYLFGAATSEREPAHATRTDALPHSPPEKPAGAPPGTAEAERLWEAPRTEVVAPDGPVDAELADGEGSLVLVFEGVSVPWVRIEGTDLQGNYDFEEYENLEARPAFVIERAPGSYFVRWEDIGGLDRYGTRVLIEADKITRLVIGGARYRLGEPAGLAVLTVRVAAAGGGWRAGARTYLTGTAFNGEESLCRLTNAEGYARFRARGGEHAIEVGSLRQPVRLGSRERKAVELRHEGRGDVVIDPALPGQYRLTPLDGSESVTNALPYPARSGRVAFYFLEEGTYELTFRYADPDIPITPMLAGEPGTALPAQTTVARVLVRGATETIPHEPSPGALEVIVAGADGASWSVRVGDGPGTTPLRPAREHLTARVEGLEPGAYAVELTADGAVRARRHAIVGPGSTTLVRVSLR